jgi:Ca-activated chloride channel homolog
MTAPLPLLTPTEIDAVLADQDGADARRTLGCLRTESGDLPLSAVHITARVTGTIAHTTVQQVFQNNLGVPLEATYIFPLPDRWAVVRFTLTVAGRVVEGELQERGAARRTYDAAMAAGKRASIAEEERPGTFTIRVGNLMPGEDATVTMELAGALPVQDGEATYRFPLVVAPRYMPGTNLVGCAVGQGTAADTDLVPDASRISPPVLLPGQTSPVQLALAVHLDPAGLPLTEVRSSLHAAWATEEEGLLRVQLPAGEKLNRDFILRYRLGDETARNSGRASDTGAGDDTFLVTLMPALTAHKPRPRDVVVVLDRSGSMGGWKMVAARRAAARLVDGLRPADRFCVLAFDTSVEAPPTLPGGLVPASDRHRFVAATWLGGVEARGGTEMLQPLERATQLLGDNDHGRDRVLVFVTDGQVGNESHLLRRLGARLAGVRVFALGIDRAVNAGFLNRLAALGGQGEAELVESEERVDEVLAHCHRRIDTPKLTGLHVHLEGGDLRAGTVAPKRLPDVFAGTPAVIFGRFQRGSGAATIVVTGKDASGNDVTHRVPLLTTKNPALPAAWARLHLRDLEDLFDCGASDRAALTSRIVQTSLQTRVLCRFTAFVAVDHEVVNAGGRQVQRVQAVERPEGWDEERQDRKPLAPSPTDAFFASAELGSPQSFESAAAPLPSRAPAGAPPLPVPAPAAPPPRSRLEGAVLQKEKARGASLLSSVAEGLKKAAGFGGGGARDQAAMPEAVLAPKGDASAGAWAEACQRLVALVERLRTGGGDAGLCAAVAEELRAILEDLAHAGVAPAKRRPIEDARAALLASDSTRALTLLTPLLPPAAGQERFWER